MSLSKLHIPIGLLLVALLLLTGCYTQKKANKQLDRGFERWPALAAEKCRKTFPLTPVKSDTVESIVYDWIEIECPDSVIITETKEGQTTIIRKKVTVTVERPDTTLIITKTVKDSADATIYRSQIGKLEKKLKGAGRVNWFLGGIAAVLLLLVFLIIFLRRK